MQKLSSNTKELEKENHLLRERLSQLEDHIKLLESGIKEEDPHLRLMENPKFLRLVLETNPDIVYIHDLDAGLTIYCNKNLLTLLDYCEEEARQINSDSIKKITHPEDQPRLEERRKRFYEVSDSEILTLEYRLRDKNGRWKTFLSRERILTRSNNRPRLVIGIATDITDFRESEKQRQALAQQHFLILKNLQSYVFKVVKNESGQMYYEFKEGKLAERVGNYGKKVTGKKPRQVYGDKLGKELESYYESAFKGKEFTYEFDFNDRSLATTLQPVWENGEIVAVIGTGNDITEQKKNLQALMESEERYRVLVEHSPNGIALAKWDGTMVWCNQSAAKVLGYDNTSDIIGKKGQQFLSLSNLPQAREIMHNFLKNRKSDGRLIFDFKRKDGSIVPLELHLDILNVGKNNDLIFVLARDMTDSIVHEQEREEFIQSLTSAYETTLEGWAKILEMRDAETEGHSRRVVELTVAMARSLNLPEKEIVNIKRGAILHDIGKMAIPDEILLKKDSLTLEEWRIMKQHPIYALKVLENIPFLNEALDIPLYHHEHWDGTGYPYKLKGEDIPLAARIFTIVDVWDALCYDRHYKEAWSTKKALDYIKSHSGTQFDPELVSLFLNVVRVKGARKTKKFKVKLVKKQSKQANF